MADITGSSSPELRAADESRVSGSATHPLLNLTVGAILENAAQSWPDHEALVVRHQNLRYSYRALNAWVDEVARGRSPSG